MAIVMMNEISSELNEEEQKEIAALDQREIVFDEDCPEMTEEMLSQFRGFNTVQIKVSSSSMKKARAFGKNYLAVLSKLLDMAINDPDMVKKCVS